MRRRPAAAVACRSFHAQALNALTFCCLLFAGSLLAAGCGGKHPATVPATPATIPSAGAAPTTPPLTPAVARLRRDIDSVLDAPQLEAGTWGVIVKSLKTGDVLYERNARKLLTPASDLKIVTLSATAEKLGWDYTYETQLLALGAIDFGFLDGDLIVRGSGDPSLIDADGMAAGVFKSWAERLKALGIRSLSGRIIGDDNAWDDDAYGSGWMYDDMNEGYSAGVGPLQFNMGETTIGVTPAQSENTPAAVTIATEGSGLVLRNKVVTTAAGTPARVGTRRIANTNILEVYGTVPAGSQPLQERVAVDNQTLYFVTELRKALIANGIEVKGPAVDIDDLPTPPRVHDAVPVVSYRSAPLNALAGTLMELSQNQYAETFLKTLGAQAGAPTFEAGRQVIADVLRSWGIDTAQVLQADGSGLSRYDVVTADALASILVHVAQDPRHDGPFRASLPVAGRPGALAHRLPGTKAAGLVRAKTGSMRHVRSTSGYTTTADGEPVVFSMIANNFGIANAEIDRASDAVILKVFEFTR